MTFTFCIMETPLYGLMMLTGPEHTQTHYCPSRSISEKLKELKLLKIPQWLLYHYMYCWSHYQEAYMSAGSQPFLGEAMLPHAIPHPFPHQPPATPVSPAISSHGASERAERGDYPGLIQASNNRCRNKAHLVQWNILLNSSLKSYLWRVDYLRH